jgi:hypothetical protein
MDSAGLRQRQIDFLGRQRTALVLRHGGDDRLLGQARVSCFHGPRGPSESRSQGAEGDRPPRPRRLASTRVRGLFLSRHR